MPERARVTGGAAGPAERSFWPFLEGRPFLKYWVPVILWAGAIFVGSSLQFHYDPQAGRHTDSYGFVLDPFSTTTYLHLVEFGVLSYLLFFAFRCGVRDPAVPSWHLPLALAVSLAYSTLDELHQQFVPTRSMDVLDLTWNALGTVVGVCLALAFVWAWARWTRRGAEK